MACSAKCETKYKNKKTLNFLNGVTMFLEAVSEEAKKVK